MVEIEVCGTGAVGWVLECDDVGFEVLVEGGGRGSRLWL